MKTKDKKETVDLTSEFGRVVSHPARHDGTPFLNGTSVTVPDILELIDNGQSDEDITNHFEDIEQKHIDICRAYRARFLAHTQDDLCHLDPCDKFFMLDENVSYPLLYDVARLFGWSSHVYADGLYGFGNNDDEKHIWKHMLDNNYKAILTEDSDFKKIARNHREKMIKRYGSIQNCPEPCPVVIFISKNCTLNDARLYLEKHRQDIIDYIENNDAAFATLSCKDFTKHALDADTMKKIALQTERPQNS